MIKKIALIWNVFVLVLTGYMVYQYGFPDVNDEKLVFLWVLAIFILTVINLIAIQQNNLPKKDNSN